MTSDIAQAVSRFKSTNNKFQLYPGATPGFGRGGGKNFFSDLGICMSLFATSTLLGIFVYQGRPQDLAGGGAKNFFFRFVKLYVAKRHAAHGFAMRFARGVRGHAPPRKFFKMVQFGTFWCTF